MECIHHQTKLLYIVYSIGVFIVIPGFQLLPLEGDKMSMLTHTYPHKLLRKIEVTICNHQADSLLYVFPA